MATKRQIIISREDHKRLENLFFLRSVDFAISRSTAVWDVLRDDPQFQTIGQLFLFIAMHEMSHRGQLADARRVLGRKPFA